MRNSSSSKSSARRGASGGQIEVADAPDGLGLDGGIRIVQVLGRIRGKALVERSRHGFERLGTAARILIQIQNRLINRDVVGLFRQANGRAGSLFDRRLRIGQHLEHGLAQFRLIADLAQRLPTSPAHRGVGVRLGKLDQTRARGVGQVRALVAERDLGSQAGRAFLKHRQPVLVFERSKVRRRFFGIERPNVERLVRFSGSFRRSRERLDDRLNGRA